MSIVNIKFNPEPTPKRFLESDKQVRFLAGTVGTGKTISVLMDIITMSINQEPKNGVRDTRWIITRATYGELQSAIVDELQAWFPEPMLKIKADKPVRAYLNFPHPTDGTLVKSQITMIGMNRPDSYTKLRSANITGGCMNEADTQHQRVFSYLSQRSARYPPPDKSIGFGGCTWGGVIGDYNPPSIRHWIYKELVLKSIKDRHGKNISEVFHMEPPVYRVRGEKSGGFYCGDYTYFENPKGEGIQYQSKGIDYWYDEIARNFHDENYIRRFILGEYVPTFNGTPVFPTFCAEDHVADREIKPIQGKPILLAFDWGRSAACTISQMDDLGRLLFLDELYDGDIVLSQFLQDKLKPLLQSKYKGFKIRALGDPSGGKNWSTDFTPFREVNEFFDAINVHTRCAKAITNDWMPRREAVQYCLSRKDGMLFSPNMELTIDAMAGNYLYATSTNNGIEKEEPLKNDASHLADTVQIHCLDFKNVGDTGNDEGYNRRRYNLHASRRRAR